MYKDKRNQARVIVAEIVKKQAVIVWYIEERYRKRETRGEKKSLVTIMEGMEYKTIRTVIKKHI